MSEENPWPAPGTRPHTILSWLKRRKTPVKSAEVAEKFGITKPAACTVLKALTDEGLIVREGTRCKYTYTAAA